jgi:hypothetical protein
MQRIVCAAFQRRHDTEKLLLELLQLLVQLLYNFIARLELPMQVLCSRLGDVPRSTLLVQLGLKALNLCLVVFRERRGVRSCLSVLPGVG